ncbi:hypothetical protein ASPCAL02991 [Aspergillus calidoustus]|uniref:C2H2-type domain-containing protein n=1 Tax=Aspergillus calidoustus TaxID=454130 RepID=A0A0U5GPF7_ASPCI|nr:hypothetical protein ASPCAL02991 [Aspergillus calidoustus]
MSQRPYINDNNAPPSREKADNGNSARHASSVFASAPQAPSSPNQPVPSLLTSFAVFDPFASPAAAAAHPGLLEYQTANWNTATTASAHGTQSAGYMGNPLEQPLMQTGHVYHAIQQLSIGDDTVPIGVTPEGTLICLWPNCSHRSSFRRKGCIKRHTITQHILPGAHWCQSCGKMFNRSDNLLSHCRRKHPESA